MSSVYEALDIDRSRLFDRFGGMEALAEKYLFAFPQDANHALLRDAALKCDADGIEHHAHTLKGMSANLELGAFSQICDRIVQLVRRQRADALPFDDAFAQRLNVLMDEYEQSYQHMAQILRR